MGKLIQKSFKGLNYLSHEESGDTALILLHGYGASQNDLAPLGEYLPPLNGARNFFFPDGIIPIPMGPYYEGRAWFPISASRLESAIENQNFDEIFKELPEGFIEARNIVVDFIKDLKEKYSKIILGGFSQGSMLAIDIALGEPQLIDKCLLLSSTLVAPLRLKDYLKNPETQKIKFFQCHGTNDQVLPVGQARKLQKLLEDANANIEYMEFNGGHEIPMPALNSLRSFLQNE